MDQGFDNAKQATEEELAELRAEAKLKFRDIKQWYQNDTSDLVNGLRKDYGEFPIFSRDFLSWNYLRPILKAFNQREHQRPEVDLQVDKGDVAEGVTGKKRRWGTKDIDEGLFSARRINSVTNEDMAISNDSGVNSSSGTTISKRVSRFSSNSTIPGGNNVQIIPKDGGTLQTLQHRTFLLRLKIDKVNKKLDTVDRDAKMLLENPTRERSPSPPPVYDEHGKRINTLPQRMRAELEEEKKQLIEEFVKLNPGIKPKNMKLSMLQKKLYVPVNDYPGFNFLGLIIGPRGMTQKRLEQETNTKITIRGKGSLKPGGRAKIEDASDEELHILIEAEDEDDLRKASEIVEKLLQPGEDNLFLEEHRQKQMTELAIINGTLNHDQTCAQCGEKGHFIWECTNGKRVSGFGTYQMANVLCKICGERSHVTADCPLKNKPEAESSQLKKIDNEYFKFLEVVGDTAHADHDDGSVDIISASPSDNDVRSNEEIKTVSLVPPPLANAHFKTPTEIPTYKLGVAPMPMSCPGALYTNPVYMQQCTQYYQQFIPIQQSSHAQLPYSGNIVTTQYLPGTGGQNPNSN